MNDGETGLIVLIISLAFGVFVLVNKKLRKRAPMLLAIPVIGIVISAVLFVRFATTTVVESDSATSNSTQTSNCAPDQLVCN